MAIVSVSKTIVVPTTLENAHFFDKHGSESDSFDNNMDQKVAFWRQLEDNMDQTWSNMNFWTI